MEWPKGRLRPAALPQPAMAAGRSVGDELSGFPREPSEAAPAMRGFTAAVRPRRPGRPAKGREAPWRRRYRRARPAPTSRGRRVAGPPAGSGPSARCCRHRRRRGDTAPSAIRAASMPPLMRVTSSPPAARAGDRASRRSGRTTAHQNSSPAPRKHMCSPTWTSRFSRASSKAQGASGAPSSQGRGRHQQDHVLRHMGGEQLLPRRVERPDQRQEEAGRPGRERTRAPDRDAAADAGAPPQAQDAADIEAGREQEAAHRPRVRRSGGCQGQRAMGRRGMGLGVGRRQQDEGGRRPQHFGTSSTGSPT
jgi:hypothetical protein